MFGFRFYDYSLGHTASTCEALCLCSLTNPFVEIVKAWKCQHSPGFRVSSYTITVYSPHSQTNRIAVVSFTLFFFWLVILLGFDLQVTLFIISKTTTTTQHDDYYSTEKEIETYISFPSPHQAPVQSQRREMEEFFDRRLFKCDKSQNKLENRWATERENITTITSCTPSNYGNEV